MNSRFSPVAYFRNRKLRLGRVLVLSLVFVILGLGWIGCAKGRVGSPGQSKPGNEAPEEGRSDAAEPGGSSVSPGPGGESPGLGPLRQGLLPLGKEFDPDLLDTAPAVGEAVLLDGRLSGENAWAAPPGIKARSVANLPSYFVPRGWVDQDTFWGLTGEHPILVETAGPEYRATGLKAWEARLSGDGKRFSYADADGVWIATVDGKGRTIVADSRKSGSGGDPVSYRGGIWSPDGGRLLTWNPHEWDADFFLAAPDGAASPAELQTVPSRLGGYFLTSPAGWLADGRLLFNTRASRMKDGTQEYGSGYRSDLALFDPVTREYRLITAVDDGEFLEAAADEHGLVPLLDGGGILAARRVKAPSGSLTPVQWVKAETNKRNSSAGSGMRDGQASSEPAPEPSFEPVPGVPLGATVLKRCGDGWLYALSETGGVPDRSSSGWQGVFPGTTRFSLFLLRPGGVRTGLVDWLGGYGEGQVLAAPGCRQVLVGFSYDRVVASATGSGQTVYDTLLVDIPDLAGR